MQPYATSLQHILAELERIDLLIQLQVWRARQVHAADEQFQGIYIPEEEVDALLATPAGLPAWARVPLAIAQPEVQEALDQLAMIIAGCKVQSKSQGITLRLDRLQKLFQLSPFEVDTLLIGLAPEIDLRYERLFGYLQDDVTKRRPSVDLLLNLLSPTFEAKLAARQSFAPQAPLRKHHLIMLFEDPSHVHPPLLSRYLKVADRIVAYLFDDDDIDLPLVPYVQRVIPQSAMADLLLPGEMKGRLRKLVRASHASEQPVLFYFQGPYGVGKATVAAAVSNEIGMNLLIVDGEKLLEGDNLAFETGVRLLLREAHLQGALILWQGFDALLREERHAWLTQLIQLLETHPYPTMLAGSLRWEPAGLLRNTPFIRVEFPRLSATERQHFWPQSLNGDGPAASEALWGELAAKFRFTPGQIQDTVVTARNIARWRDPDDGQLTLDDLYAAGRLQSNQKLGELARKITPHYTWDDIVLPADRMRQLREIVNQVKYRTKVYDEWGFDHKLAMGKGLNALFAGPSGTGKTMAADIMAGALGLDLYKIDLSSVVSKYIGETEKNLARIFTEAETSNAILFFDEADALFGKRSEVRDSHDRYANIETSYLLQRMEEYDGMTILATNLSKNLDDAFVRRMHFTIEFPFPDEKQRLRIWEKVWPAETPIALSPTVLGNGSANAALASPQLTKETQAQHPVDLAFMARRFEMAGGNIRNIALAAAFLAADDGEVVCMHHLIQATQREYQKMGKVIVDDEFNAYAHYVRRDA
ncbi:MAG: ATP-binding protein [Caldilineaceae bacterium]|nr:ATP-binding protein [Caldilineaceae bacterium]